MPQPNLRVVVQPPIEPASHPGWYRSIIAGREFETLAIRDNAWFEPMTRMVAMAWDLDTDKDTTVSDVTVHVTPEERAAIEAAKLQYQTEIDEINAKTNKTSEDIQRIDTLNRMMDELSRTVYLEDSVNGFGDGATCLYRTLSAPNIPFSYQLNERLDADRPFAMWIYRFQPEEEQAHPEFNIRIGDRFRIQFLQGSQAKVYRHKEGLSLEDVLAREQEIEEILDRGRLTAADREAIAEKEAQIRALKAGKSAGELSDEDAQLIKTLASDIDAIRKSKSGLSSADQALLNAKLRQIYENVQDIDWQETDVSLFNRPFTIVVIPDPRGYLLLKFDLGKNTFVFSLDDVLKSGRKQTILPQAPIRLWGNGGAFMFKWAYLRIPTSATLLSRDLHLGFTFGGDADVTWDWNDAPRAGFTVTLSPGVSENTLVYQVDMSSDGRYLPLLYAIDIAIPAGERIQDTTVLWDSDAYTGTIDPIYEVTPSFSIAGGRISRTCEIVVTDIGNVLSFLSDDVRHQVTIYDKAQSTTDPIFTGVVQSVSGETLAGGGAIRRRIFAVDRGLVSGEFSLSDPPKGDGMSLGDYMRLLLRERGFKDAEIQINAAEKLPAARPGERPSVHPSSGTTLAAALDYLHETWALFEIMEWTRDGRFRYEEPQTQTYSSTFSTTVNSNRHYVKGTNDALSLDDWYSTFRVRGAVNPVTKRRYAADFVDYGGIAQYKTERVYGLIEDDSLTSAEAVNRKCMRLVQLYNAPPIERQVTIPWHSDLDPGMRISIGGTTYEILRIDGSYRNDEMTLSLREVT